jgi:tRNA pseudouridine32 synthase/23S rRNA pseudouridine746 synthase
MATSGLMVFARGEAMQRELSRMFREREVNKRYEALVAGDLREGKSEGQSQVKSSLTLALSRGERGLSRSVDGERECPRAVGEEWWEIDLPLMVDWPNRPKSKVDYELGKPSLTRYRLLGIEKPVRAEPVEACAAMPYSPFDKLRANGSLEVVSRLELEPITGRTHQLRLHLASIGYPIIGDTLYEGRSAERLMLHATRLAFDHPITAKPLCFESDAPY